MNRIEDGYDEGCIGIRKEETEEGRENKDALVQARTRLLARSMRAPPSRCAISERSCGCDGRGSRCAAYERDHAAPVLTRVASGALLVHWRTPQPGVEPRQSAASRGEAVCIEPAVG